MTTRELVRDLRSRWGACVPQTLADTRQRRRLATYYSQNSGSQRCRPDR
jgi:hypothetical protein